MRLQVKDNEGSPMLSAKHLSRTHAPCTLESHAQKERERAHTHTHAPITSFTPVSRRRVIAISGAAARA